jgi:hypothetical protein
MFVGRTEGTTTAICRYSVYLWRTDKSVAIAAIATPLAKQRLLDPIGASALQKFLVAWPGKFGQFCLPLSMLTASPNGTQLVPSNRAICACRHGVRSRGVVLRLTPSMKSEG